MPLYDTKCFECGAEQEEHRKLSEAHICPPCTCGGEYRIIIKTAPSVQGSTLDGSFTPHYDTSAGRYFQHASEKTHWLKETGKVQLGGNFSPKLGDKGKSQIPMTKDQAKKGISSGDL